MSQITDSEKESELMSVHEKVKELTFSMYAHQVCLLIIAFILGVYIPLHLDELMQLSILGL